MAEIEFTQDSLIIHIKGLDAMLSFKGHLDIPLIHIIKVEFNPQEVRTWLDNTQVSIKSPGTHIPGILMAGTFYQQDEWVFWDVDSVDHAIIIHLTHEHYSKVVINVENPESTVAKIEERVRARKVV